LTISLGKIPKKLNPLWETLLVIYKINLIRLEKKQEKLMVYLVRELIMMLKEILTLLIKLGDRY